MRSHAYTLALTLLVLTTASLAGAAGEAAHPAVGAWLVEWDFGEHTEALAVIHSDGTMVVSHDTNDYAGGYVSETDNMGQWKKTGPREATGRFLALVFDPSTGVHVAYNRLTLNGVISHDGDTFEASMDYEVFFLPHDPLDPEQLPDIAYYGIPILGQRIVP